MPAHKHNRHNRTREDEHNNNVDEQQQQQQQQQQYQDIGLGGGGQQHNNNYNNQQQGQGANDNQNTSNQCCVPNGCSDIKDLIDPSDPCDAVRVVCNNENCTVGQWMHKFCFETWEQGVLAYLRSCGRARSWSEKQRLQNLWTKKGYDLAFKACDCRCSRGHLRKDLNYIPPPQNDNAKKNRKHKKKNDKPIAVMTSKSGMNPNHNTNTHGGRLRTNSISTGSSPPNNYLSSSPTTPAGSPSQTNNVNNQLKKNKPENGDSVVAGNTICGSGGNGTGNEVSGSIFKRRNDLSAFKNLRRYKQNPYYIKMEDECSHGNDDTRIFVLSTLSIHKMGSLPCVLCRCELPVFDRYPLIDGTLFLSPEPYQKNTVKETAHVNSIGGDSTDTNFQHHQIQVVFDGKPQYLNAVCIHCLEGKTDIRCSACKKRWDGSTLLLGTMYSYDIFAAMPCCPKRLTCRHCCRAVVDVTTGLPYYSEYSHIIECPYCKIKDYHFIRPLHEIFLVKTPIWN
ncbi:Hypothetical predicted protein [Octopus vulgaris]|uniref:Headcase middle domain-containing protein n=1 Tax=Octopus vulgaris TaxID=6645 RepID=A0AA36B7U8_OCTVU|nr:Hypothetical predicted protein [Octopus vulgaris]